MKNCLSLAAMSVLPSFYLMSRNMTDAAFSHGNGITALQLAIAVLVGALYTANHFKGRIKTFLSTRLKVGKGEVTKS